MQYMGFFAKIASMQGRIDPNSYTSDKHWGQTIAEEVIRQFPNEEVYTCAAGISPSGMVHFGNFRDVVTAYVVFREFARLNKKTRMIYSWDDFDRFRKVPANVPEDFEKYIGTPYAKMPAPSGDEKSYARHFEIPFETAMKELKIDLEYKYQANEYTSGTYTESIIHALKNRKEIAKILLSFMTEKGKEEKKINEEEYIENYYPISVYSRFSGKDNTKVISYDGEYEVTYKCFDTDKEDTLDLRKDGIVKLQWKVDWPMRWKHEGVVFEPGGHDHASPGSSYDIGTVMSPKIFGRPAPIFAEYKFVGIQGLGSKMSGSKGNTVSPTELLEIYEPAILRWIYFRKTPAQSFQLAFDTEVYRQYEEFDKEIALYKEGKLDGFSTRALELALEGFENIKEQSLIPFRQAAAFGQIVQWDLDKMIDLLSSVGLSYDKSNIESRLLRAKNWLTKYNPDEMIIIRDSINQEYSKNMSVESKKYVKELADYLSGDISSVEELEKKVYAIPKDESLDQKENSKRQRAFFKDVYNLLISVDTGPRLSTFIWALGKEKVSELLKI